MKEPKAEGLSSPASDLAPETASSSVDTVETVSNIEGAEVAPVAFNKQGKATKVQEVQWSNFGLLEEPRSVSKVFTVSSLSEDVNAAAANPEGDFFSFTNQASSDVGSNVKQQYDDVSFFDLQPPRSEGRTYEAVDGPSRWGGQAFTPQAPVRLESEKQQPAYWESRGREKQAHDAQVAEDTSWESVQSQAQMDQLSGSRWNNPHSQFGKLGSSPGPWVELAEYPGWFHNAETGEWAGRNQQNAGHVMDTSWDDASRHNQTGDVTPLTGQFQDHGGTPKSAGTNVADASQADQPTASSPMNDWVGDQVSMAQASVKSNPLFQESVVRETGLIWQESSGEPGGSQPQSRWQEKYPGWHYDNIAGEYKQCDQISPASTLPQAEVQLQSALLTAAVTSEQGTPTDVFSQDFNGFRWSTPQIQQYSADGYHFQKPPGADDGAVYSAQPSCNASAQEPDSGRWAAPHRQYLNNFSYDRSGLPQSNGANQHPDSMQTSWDASANLEQVSFREQLLLASRGQYNSFTTAQLPGRTSQSGRVTSSCDSRCISQLAYQTPPKSLEEAMRNSIGRPPHVLTSFGFGGKLLIMKLKNPRSLHASDGRQSIASGQAVVPGLVHVHTLSQVVAETAENGRGGVGNFYFGALSRSISSGPLVGGSISNKELYKWLDERTGSCESEERNLPSSSSLPKLWGLLKLTCKHYGKVRSQAGSAKVISQEEDSAEAALGKLLTSGRDQSSWTMGSLGHAACLQPVPPEHQLQLTAAEVKKLLVLGKHNDALKCAQQGQLWGPALVLARQLGEKCYADTVAEMAQRQFLPGFPLRTLSLLLAGRPAEVFKGNHAQDAPSQQLSLNPLSSGNSVEGGLESMLEEWEENLSVMAANRTSGDDAVIFHLGDCLWTVKGEVAAAHICYLVADATFDSFSSTARLCLVGADHWKRPRTYATPEAIQKTEVYEYSKVLGNPQLILAPFQPYKVIYASMLAEAGKTMEALRYCQSVLKILKASSRSLQTDACRSAAASLEERLKFHSQGGSSVNLAPVKLVKGFLSALDRGIHGIIGGPPLPAVTDLLQMDGTVEPASEPVPLAANCYGASPSWSTAPLGPSASAEKLKERGLTMPQRSISEPDFSAKLKEKTQSMKPNIKGPGYLHRFGSVFSKAGGIISLVSKTSKKEAKLGDKNAFYYDERLKMWVEEGSTAVQEEAVLPPPPISANISKNRPEFCGLGVTSANPSTAVAPPAAPASVSKGAHLGTPPVPPSNQFSARSRQHGVRSRYVDTFNKGGNPTIPLKAVHALPPTGNVGGTSSQPVNIFVPEPVVETFNGTLSSSSNVQPEDRLESHLGCNLEAALDTPDQQHARQLSSVRTVFSQSETLVSGMYSADGSDGPSALCSSAVQTLPSSDGRRASFFGKSDGGVTSSGNGIIGFDTGYHSRANSWSGSPSNFENSQKDLNSSLPDVPVTQFTTNNGFSASTMNMQTVVESYFPPSSETEVYSGTGIARKDETFLSTLRAMPPFMAITGDDSGSSISAAETKHSNEADASLLGDDLQEVEL